MSVLSPTVKYTNPENVTMLVDVVYKWLYSISNCKKLMDLEIKWDIIHVSIVPLHVACFFVDKKTPKFSEYF